MTGQDVLAELRRQTQWLRLLGLQQLRPLLDRTLESDSHRLVYELSDGERTVREIATAAKVGAATMSRLWNRWASIGIVVENERHAGRMAHLISLTDLGMPVPGILSSPAGSGGTAPNEEVL